MTNDQLSYAEDRVFQPKQNPELKIFYKRIRIKKMNFGFMTLKGTISLLGFTGVLLSLEIYRQIASLDSCIKKFCQP